MGNGPHLVDAETMILKRGLMGCVAARQEVVCIAPTPCYEQAPCPTFLLAATFRPRSCLRLLFFPYFPCNDKIKIHVTTKRLCTSCVSLTVTVQYNLCSLSHCLVRILKCVYDDSLSISVMAAFCIMVWRSVRNKNVIILFNIEPTIHITITRK